MNVTKATERAFVLTHIYPLHEQPATVHEKTQAYARLAHDFDDIYLPTLQPKIAWLTSSILVSF